MPDITNRAAVIYSQETLRPISEDLLKLKAKIDVAIIDWNNGLNALFTNDASAIIDNNAIAHPFTGANANGVVTSLIAAQTTINSQITHLVAASVRVGQ